MKRGFLSVCFSLLGVLLLFAMKETLHASATGDLIVSASVTELTAAQISSTSFIPGAPQGLCNVSGLEGLQAGHFMVTVRVDQNSGFNCLGVAAIIDYNNFEVFMKGTSIIAVTIMGSGAGNNPADILYNKNNGRFGLVLSSPVSLTQDGVLFYAFMKRKDNAPNPNAAPYVGTNVTQAVGEESNDLVVEEPTAYVPADPNAPTIRYIELNYMLGDLDGNGTVDTIDANLAAQILLGSTSMNEAAVLARVQTLIQGGIYTFAGMFNTGHFIFEVADIYQTPTGIFNQDDVDQINYYYAAIVTLLDPEDLGCVPGIGEWHTKTIQVVIT